MSWTSSCSRTLCGLTQPVRLSQKLGKLAMPPAEAIEAQQTGE